MSPTSARHSAAAAAEIERFMNDLRARNPHEPEFQQAVQEVVDSIIPFTLEHPRYGEDGILERITEPDRAVIFRVTWEDDERQVHSNRAFRVQFNNAIGPYKGGLRFHPEVTLSVLKFLGFEQVFKNSLTGLPMGGAKGGANFDPKGKSDREIMRFCQSLMIEMHRHIGPHTDIPAGDIGVGAREISYLFGQYKRIENEWTGTLTGKGLSYGGSLMRKEATGYGAVYFAQNMLGHQDMELEGRVAVVSGSGNVSLYCIEKLIALGAKVVAASDSGGFVHDSDGFDADKLEYLKELKEVRRGRISEYAEKFAGATYHAGERPWGIPCELAFPCATQNELDGDDANALIDNGLVAVAEGANMPSTLEAISAFRSNGVLFAPGKAANSGGVAVSGLEQSQNAQRLSWEREKVDEHLKEIMTRCHAKCVEFGDRGEGYVDYVDGANLAGFVKVADAMLAYGVA